MTLDMMLDQSSVFEPLRGVSSPSSEQGPHRAVRTFGYQDEWMWYL